MDVATLRNPAPVRAGLRQHISLYHGDRLVEIGQHPRRQQTTHAGPENDRMFTEFRHQSPVPVPT